MKYQIIYPFEALKAIENGRKVYMLDRKYICTANVSNLTVEELVEIFKQDAEEPKRFEFWTQFEAAEEDEEYV